MDPLGLDVTYCGKKVTAEQHAILKEMYGEDSPFIEFLADRIHNHTAVWGLETMVTEDGLRGIQEWYERRHPPPPPAPPAKCWIGAPPSEVETREAERLRYLNRLAGEATCHQYPPDFPLARQTAMAQGSVLMGATGPGQALVVLDAVATLKTESDPTKQALADLVLFWFDRLRLCWAQRSVSSA